LLLAVVACGACSTGNGERGVTSRGPRLFRMLKRVFGCTKAPHRDMKKNRGWMCATFPEASFQQH